MMMMFIILCWWNIDDDEDDDNNYDDDIDDDDYNNDNNNYDADNDNCNIILTMVTIIWYGDYYDCDDAYSVERTNRYHSIVFNIKLIMSLYYS